MSGIDEQVSDDFRCSECGSIDFERTSYSYRKIRINIESGTVLKGNWRNEDTDGWECMNCGHWVQSDGSLGEKLYQMDRSQP